MMSDERLVVSNRSKAATVPSHLQVADLQNWHFASPFPDCITNHPPPVISISIGSTGETFCKQIRWSRYTVTVVSFVIGKTVVTAAAAGNRFAGANPVRKHSCHRAVSGHRSGKLTRKENIYRHLHSTSTQNKVCPCNIYRCHRLE